MPTAVGPSGQGGNQSLTSNPYWAMCVTYGNRYGLSPYLLSAQEWVESSWDPAAVSPTGAFGISQFEPGTAAEYGVQRGTSTADVESQINGQASYMANLVAAYNGNISYALQAYNGGAGGVGGAEEEAYASEIIGLVGAAGQDVGSGGLTAPAAGSGSKPEQSGQYQSVASQWDTLRKYIATDFPDWTANVNRFAAGGYKP